MPGMLRSLLERQGNVQEEIRAGSSLLFLYGCSYINMATFFLVQKCLYAVELQLHTLEHF